MELYFSPMSSSLAARAALYEASADVRFIEVDRKTKRCSDGTDLRAIFPLALVPLLRLDDGRLLSENVAILQYIADRLPTAGLAPSSGLHLQQWLSFIATEMHKAIFAPLLDANAPDGTRTHILKKFEPRLQYLNDHLTGREYCSTALPLPTPISIRCSTGRCRHGSTLRPGRRSRATTNTCRPGRASRGRSSKRWRSTKPS